MSENKQKPKLDLNKLNIIEVSEIPAKASKGIWQNWINVLQMLSKTPSKAFSINENEASLPAIRNQIAKAVKKANIEGITLNSRNINKTQTLFISYKKPVKKQ
jgi:hypothetical protein